MIKEEKKEFSIPTHIVHKGKNIYLNLNAYRNWHHFNSNTYKKNYKARIYEILDSSFLFSGKVHIEYTYYSPDKRVRDLMNVISIADKFLQDALVELGYISADDTSVVVKITSVFGGIDRENSRIDVKITNFKQE